VTRGRLPSLLGSLVVALFAVASLRPVPAATLRVGNSSAPAFNFLPLTIGVQQKFFAAQGLDIEIVNLEGSAKLHQTMVAGAIDMGLGAGTDIAFLVKGAPEIAVGAITISPAQLGVVVPSNSPIHALADLKGKRIGVSTVGSLTQWLALQLAKKQGWTRDDLIFVTDGSTSPPQLAALETGEVDAQVSAAALGWYLEEQQKGRLLAPASDFVGAFLMNVIYASHDIVQRDPEAIRAFLKGWYEAVDFMARDKAQTIQIARSVDHFSQAVEDKQYDDVMPSLSRDGTFPPEAVAPVKNSFVELGILPTEPDMTQYLTTAFLPQKG
jgi:NitT/TauT family transport system substrate-binding protein